MNAPKELQTLRGTIVNGDPKISLVSALRWDSPRSQIEFYASHARVDQMLRDEWHVAMVRLDTYKVLMKPAPIKALVK
jgi:hypothetical protein